MARLARWAPLTGVIAVVLFVVAILVSGESPDTDVKNAQAIVDFFSEDKQDVSGVLLAYSGLFIVAFGIALVRVLGLAGTPALGVGALAGTLLMAVAIGGFATQQIELADLAGTIEPETFRAMYGAPTNFIALLVGGAILVWSFGFAALASPLLPSWLGWVSIPLALVLVTPLGFFVSLVLALWIVAVTVVAVRLVGREEPVTV
ncbi:MAG: hypothetical protein ACR2NA_00730 [Solirubrobacterales bacterium]